MNCRLDNGWTVSKDPLSFFLPMVVSNKDAKLVSAHLDEAFIQSGWGDFSDDRIASIVQHLLVYVL